MGAAEQQQKVQMMMMREAGQGIASVALGITQNGPEVKSGPGGGGIPCSVRETREPGGRSEELA